MVVGRSVSHGGGANGGPFRDLRVSILKTITITIAIAITIKTLRLRPRKHHSDITTPATWPITKNFIFPP